MTCKKNTKHPHSCQQRPAVRLICRLQRVTVHLPHELPDVDIAASCLTQHIAPVGLKAADGLALYRDVLGEPHAQRLLQPDVEL
jgi:hypothetical protein